MRTLFPPCAEICPGPSERPHVERGAKYVAPPFRRGSQKRVDWLVNISNDGWFVRFKNAKVYPSAEQPQHAAVCAFRAVENRLPVVRSVNTGISCLIDSLGRIRDGYIAASSDFPAKAMERTGMAGWFVDKMPIDSRVTFFSKYGQWLDFSCTACLVLLIIWMLWTKLRASNKMRLLRFARNDVALEPLRGAQRRSNLADC